jgi:hypothetical protein
VTHAPRAVVVLVPVGTGDNGAWGRAKPDYRRHKAVRKDAPWPGKQSIPSWDRNELLRRIEEVRRATRAQVEALKAAGREMLAESCLSQGGVRKAARCRWG